MKFFEYLIQPCVWYYEKLGSKLMLCLFWLVKTGISGAYREGNGANVWSKVLLDGASIAELVAWGYHPETHGCIGINTHPSMNSVIPVFTWVLVFVIHLNPTQKPSFLSFTGIFNFEPTKEKTDKQTLPYTITIQICAA